jgi:hypothetical protein
VVSKASLADLLCSETAYRRNSDIHSTQVTPRKLEQLLASTYLSPVNRAGLYINQNKSYTDGLGYDSDDSDASQTTTVGDPQPLAAETDTATRSLARLVLTDGQYPIPSLHGPNKYVTSLVARHSRRHG